MVADNRQPRRLDLSAIILVGPRYPENIGAAARIALNFGIAKLIVVAKEQPDQERMLKMATHQAARLIHEMELHRHTGDAVAPFHVVVGTTARRGRRRTLEQTPREVMGQVASLPAGQRIGLMFGPENTGLTNRDLDYCQFSSTIPTADFSSLNLAQAVAIHCYELAMAVNSTRTAPLPQSDYANSYELEGMYAHIEQILTTTTYLGDYNRTLWMRNIRQFLGRVRIKKKEACMIRGICRKLLWHGQESADRRPGPES